MNGVQTKINLNWSLRRNSIRLYFISTLKFDSFYQLRWRASLVHNNVMFIDRLIDRSIKWILLSKFRTKFGSLWLVNVHGFDPGGESLLKTGFQCQEDFFSSLSFVFNLLSQFSSDSPLGLICLSSCSIPRNHRISFYW